MIKYINLLCMIHTIMKQENNPAQDGRAFNVAHMLLY
jgi:hypothetical protein